MPAERPDSACVLCPPPTSDLPWRLADQGYRTCARCLDQLRATLRDVVARYIRLSARPGDTGTSGRGRPGFASRAPGSEHVIALRDRRSKPCEVSWDATTYVWDPLAETVLEPGQLGPPSGAYVQKLDVWYGRDGRPHTEATRPPRSAPQVLDALAELIAEQRDMKPPTRTRPCPTAGLPHTHLDWTVGYARRVPPPDPPIVRTWRWLDTQLDWVTRQDWAADFARDVREIEAQLRPVTGDPGGRRIGLCPNTLDEGATTRPCRTPLYAPLRGDTIVCPNRDCGRRWPRAEWIRLGELLGAQ